MRTQPKGKQPDEQQREKWSSEKEASLERMWRAGETASVIAQTLHVSRSAVIGKIFRLRLSAAGGAPAAASPEHRRRGRTKGQAAPSPPSPSPAPPPSPPPSKKRGKSLLELTNGDCRWPIGDPGSKKFHYCGEPGADVELGLPYCRAHMQRAYVVAPPRMKTGSALGGWYAVSPGISATVRRLFREAIARKERT